MVITQHEVSTKYFVTHLIISITDKHRSDVLGLVYRTPPPPEKLDQFDLNSVCFVFFV